MLKVIVFCHLQKKFGNKYGQKLMDTASKTGIDAAKAASKRVVRKSAKSTGDVIGNNLSDKITSIGKPKEKEQKKQKKFIFHQKKENKLLMT